MSHVIVDSCLFLFAIYSSFLVPNALACQLLFKFSFY